MPDPIETGDYGWTRRGAMVRRMVQKFCEFDEGRPMTDYEQTYEEFWKGIVEKDGVLNLDLVKRELHDYRQMIEDVSKVYCHVTDGMISKPNTHPDAVIAAHLDDVRRMIDEAIEDEKEQERVTREEATGD